MEHTSTEEQRIRLLGFIKISLEIKAKTGLHIGGAADSLDKGGIDSPVIKNPVTNQPYVPGSSLRGRMRSLLEKKGGRPLKPMTSDKTIWMEIYPEKEYPNNSTNQAKNSEVCRVFGDSSCSQNVPSVLIVRDALYTENTINDYIKDDLPITEAKIEIAVDRITAHALPRTIERVPAGAVFESELIYKVQTYEDGMFYDTETSGFKSDEALVKDIKNILDLLQMIEDFEGLGGKTSRGSGRVEINLKKLIIKKYSNNGSGDVDIDLSEEFDKKKKVIDKVMENPFFLDKVYEKTGAQCAEYENKNI